MADKEQEYISALQDFSRSVEYLVEAIEAQTNNNNKDLQDIIGSAKEQAKELAETASKLVLVAEQVHHTKSNTDEILKIVKGIKRKNQNGIWDTLSAKDKTKGVGEGIATIAIMAGAILAIGSAFKIIGDVDFGSVLALSIALPLMAYAFNKVGETVDNPKDAMGIAVSMVAMSAGIAASGFILSMMPSLSFGQMITAVAVAVSIGAAMYGLAMAADELGRGDTKKMYAIVPLMPVVAAAIVASGLILENMPTLGMNQFVSTLGVGVAMGAAMIPLAFAAKLMGESNSGDLLELGIMMPIMAASIVASSFILQGVAEVDTLNTLEAAFAIGGSTTIMAGAIWAMTKMNLGIKDVVIGTLGMTIMSGGLMLMSHILAQGNYTGGPTAEWASGVGLAMLGYLPSVLATGLLVAGTGGLGAIAIVAGIASMLAIAEGLVLTSEIISQGTYTGGPSVEWSSGVGMALMAFANAMDTMSPGVVDMIFGETMDSRIASMISLGYALNEVGAVVSAGTFVGGPSKEWAQGTGMAIMLFANALNEIKPNMFERFMGDTMDKNIEGIVKLGGALNRIGVAVGSDKSAYTGGPSIDWAKGVGMTLVTFTEALENMDDGWFSDSIDDQIDNMVKIAAAIPRIARAIGTDVIEGGPSKEWAAGVGSTVEAFASAIATLADEIDPEDLDAWIPIMKKMAPMIKAFAWQFNGVPFDNYPSKDWSKGVMSFMSGFSEIGNGSNVTGQAKQIKVLAGSFFMLSRSISSLAGSLKKITKVPDLSGIYGGLVTLSLVDNKNLNNVLASVNEKKGEFNSVLNMLKANDVIISETSYGRNKADAEIVKGKGKQINTTQAKQQQAVVTSVKPKVAVSTKPLRTDVLLNQLIELNKKVLEVMNEIAENTGGSNASAGIK